jgi:anti-sigma factor RsiW
MADDDAELVALIDNELDESRRTALWTRLAADERRRQRYEGHCHAATDLRSFWSPGSQRDGEDQLRWIPVPAGDH